MIEKEDCDTRPAQQFCVYFNEEDVLITRISSTFHLASGVQLQLGLGRAREVEQSSQQREGWTRSAAAA